MNTRIDHLHTIDGETLLTTPMPPLRFIVPGLLPQGLHILAGPPKVGKSWLALWLCLQISKGAPVWDRDSRRGSVLYLCLEDSYTRIQRRLLDITDDAPDNLFFATLSAKLREGLEQQIEQFLTKHTDTTLVVIDTLQRIRSSSNEANPYASDYRDLGILKELADRYGIALFLIHHLRKMNDDDPMNMISGTTGISGAVDSSFVLKPANRGSEQATLYCTGRDIEYQELALRFCKETHVWELAEPVTQNTPRQDPQLISLSAFLSSLHFFTGTATELSELLGRQTGEHVLPSVLSKRLVRYSAELDKLGIHVTGSRTRDSRLLHIACDGSDGNDGKMATGSVPNLLSQPSHLSQAPCLPV